MTKQEMLYSQVDSHLNICEPSNQIGIKQIPCKPNCRPNCKKKCGEDGTEVNIYELNNILQMNVYNFLNFKIDGSDSSANLKKILLEIDVEKFMQVVRESYNIKNRKTLFSLFQKCYNELHYNYVSHASLTILEDVIVCKRNFKVDSKKIAKKLNTKLAKWMLYRERNISENYYYYPGNVYKIGDVYVDVKQGKFMDKIDKKQVSIKGGVVIDKGNYSWITNMVNTIYVNPQPPVKTHNTNVNKLFSTKATVVICDPTFCELWKEKMDNLSTIYNKKLVYQIVTTKRAHQSLSYDDVKNLDLLIVSNNFLHGRSYKSLYEDYIIDEMINLEDLFSIIVDEYQDYSGIKSKTQPILSLIFWNRLIIDGSSADMMRKNSDFNEMVSTINSKYRWAHLNGIPEIKDDVEFYYKYLTGDNSIEFPLYDDNEEISLVENMFHRVVYKPGMVKESHCDVEASDYEVDIFNTLNDYEKSVSAINTLANNSVNMSQLKDRLLEHGVNKNYVDSLRHNNNDNNNSGRPSCKTCMICCEPMRNTCVTHCGHQFCISCIIKNMEYSSQCPQCRDSIDYSSLYFIKEEKIVGSKLDKISKMVEESGPWQKRRVLIYANDDVSLRRYSQSLPKGRTFYCVGNMNKKLETIRHFNCSNDIDFGSIILLRCADHDLSRYVSNLDQVVFMDPFDSDMDRETKYTYFGGNFLANQKTRSDKKLEVMYLSLVQSVESKAMHT